MGFFLGFLFSVFALFTFSCLDQFGLSDRGRRTFVMTLVAGVITNIVIQVIIIIVVVAFELELLKSFHMKCQWQENKLRLHRFPRVLSSYQFIATGKENQYFQERRPSHARAKYVFSNTKSGKVLSSVTSS